MDFHQEAELTIIWSDLGRTFRPSRNRLSSILSDRGLNLGKENKHLPIAGYIIRPIKMTKFYR